MSGVVVRVLVVFSALACVAVAALSRAADADAHWTPRDVVHLRLHAVNLAWCGRSDRWCYAGRQAWRIARCETGGTFDVWAGHGKHQYWGLFQMGEDEREAYGHGWTGWKQARAAHRYWLLSGWHPWDCARIVGIL